MTAEDVLITSRHADAFSFAAITNTTNCDVGKTTNEIRRRFHFALVFNAPTSWI